VVDAGTQFGFAPLAEAVVVVEPGVLLAVVPGLAVVLVLGVEVLALGVAVEEEPMLLPLVLPREPVLLDPTLLPVVPLTLPFAVVLAAGTPLEVVDAAVVPTGHGFAVVAPPATEPEIPVVPGFVVVAPPTPVLADPED
jgi:hypothetical protein